MATTLVTALYDIGRDKLSGKCAYRSFDKYLDWFKYTLSINVPMVVYVPEYLENYVLEHRNEKYPTKIIVREFEDLHAYEYYHRMQDTIDKMTNVKGAPSYFKDCPEFITAKYETIIFSKFDFLKETSDDNPFDSEYFIWLDAGTFYDPPPFDVTIEWPDPYKIKILDGKFLVSDYLFNLSDKSPLNDKREYLTRHQNDICAYILGGSKDAIQNVHTKFWNEVDNALDLGVINNEQHFLQLMVLQDPDDYYIYYRTKTVHYDRKFPLRDRMIPYELSLGTEFGVPYSVNNNLKLLTVATIEVGDSSFSKWRKSATHYGYNYEILGRKDRWGGFNTKIREFYKALQHVKAPYVVATDCTDVFFAGSSHELLDNFIAEGKDLIVGGEMYMHYPKGQNDYDKVKQFFMSIKESQQQFPNTGFLMGKTSELLKLMELNIDHPDDQAACFDAMYEHKIHIDIDYKTALIGNVPNYHALNHESVGYYELDPKMGRYKNKLNGNYPCVFHFPGGNFDVMQDFYVKSQPLLVANSISTTDDSSIGWILLAVIIIMIIILVIAAGFNRWIYPNNSRYPATGLY